MHQLWRISIAIWVLVLIATPISIWTNGPQIFPTLAVLGVLAQFASVLIALLMSWSVRRVFVTLSAVAVLTWIAEAIGVKTGFPFGEYSYSALFQPQIAGVPVIIPLAWFMMLVPAWALTEIIIQPNGENSNRLKRSAAARLAFAVVAGLVFTAWDFYLDPQMVDRGLWVWEKQGFYFGIPLTNFLGWFLVSSVITWLLNPGFIGSSRLFIIYVLTWLFQVIGLGIFWNQPGPALTGFLAMGIFVVLAIRKGGITWWSFSGALLGSSAAQYRSRS